MSASPVPLVPELISFQDAARLTGVSERTLTRMTERGELTLYRFGSTKRLSRQEILQPRPLACPHPAGPLTEQP
jgi:excisionase family DNA binding protein